MTARIQALEDERRISAQQAPATTQSDYADIAWAETRAAAGIEPGTDPDGWWEE